MSLGSFMVVPAWRYSFCSSYGEFDVIRVFRYGSVRTPSRWHFRVAGVPCGCPAICSTVFSADVGALAQKAKALNDENYSAVELA